MTDIMARGEAKVAGGKLIAVRFTLSHSTWHAHIDGDFFVIGSTQVVESAIAELETVLTEWITYLSQIQQIQTSDKHKASALANRLAVYIHEKLDGSTAKFEGVNATAVVVAAAKAVSELSEKPNVWGQFAQEYGQVLTRVFERESEQNALKVPEAVSQPQIKVLEDFAQRWKNLAPKVYIDIPRTASEQMELDARIAQEVADGGRPATLRIWQWKNPAIIVGKFQSIPDQVHVDTAKKLGFDIVRRTSGGGAMIVEPQGSFTYSLYVPSDFVEGLDPRDTYRLGDWWMVQGLQQEGIDISYAGFNDLASSKGKIAGAAQRKFIGKNGEALLHHTTFAWALNSELVPTLLKISQTKLSDKSVQSAAKRVDPLSRQMSISYDQLLMKSLYYALQTGAQR